MSDVNHDDATTLAQRREAGRAALAAVHGPLGLGYVDRLDAVAPAMADQLLAFYGTVYARPGLDTRSRQIATIAALIVLGDCGPELAIHARSALRAGLTRTELMEIVLQMTGYVGLPRALAALEALGPVFAEAAEDTAAADRG